MLASSSTPLAWLPQRLRSATSAAALGTLPPSMDHTRTERVVGPRAPALPACGMKIARKGKPVASSLRLASQPLGSCTRPAHAT
jgi:hypothetical protein